MWFDIVAYRLAKKYYIFLIPLIKHLIFLHIKSLIHDGINPEASFLFRNPFFGILPGKSINIKKRDANFPSPLLP